MAIKDGLPLFLRGTKARLVSRAQANQLLKRRATKQHQVHHREFGKASLYFYQEPGDNHTFGGAIWYFMPSDNVYSFIPLNEPVLNDE